jgi:hypothetical protein
VVAVTDSLGPEGERTPRHRPRSPSYEVPGRLLSGSVTDRDRQSGSGEGPGLVRAAIRTPRAAAVAGIVFSVLVSVALALTNVLLTQSALNVGRWLANHMHRDTASVVLALVPIAGIAFLWFIGVIRDHLGQAEDRFFSTVFLGSGLLLVASGPWCK